MAAHVSSYALPSLRIELSSMRAGQPPAFTHFGSCIRLRPPADTRRMLAGRLSRFGITRVADVTGLDRIGIPVVVAVRPAAKSLSVAQGKGLSLDAAIVSAIMESIEVWHAEHAAHPIAN